MNMDIWVIGIQSQLTIRGFYSQFSFLKNEAITKQNYILCDSILNSPFLVFIFAFDGAVFYETFPHSVIVILPIKR